MINLYLILPLVIYIYILLRWIIRRRFFRCRIIRQRKCQQRKKGKARLSVPCPLSSISYRGGCYRPDLKSSKQVVHLWGHLHLHAKSPLEQDINAVVVPGKMRVTILITVADTAFSPETISVFKNTDNRMLSLLLFPPPRGWKQW